MPTPNGQFCTDRLDHCSVPLKDQPKNLIPQDDLFWACPNCDQNYYFDGLICTHCGIQNCMDCVDSLTCTQCQPSHNLFEGECYLWIDHCSVSKDDQP